MFTRALVRHSTIAQGLPTLNARSLWVPSHARLKRGIILVSDYPPKGQTLNVSDEMVFRAGPKTQTTLVLESFFTITPYTEPEPSGGAAQRRRRARALQQLPFKCEKGFSYCPTGPETFGCTDTSSNLICEHR